METDLSEISHIYAKYLGPVPNDDRKEDSFGEAHHHRMVIRTCGSSPFFGLSNVTDACMSLDNVNLQWTSADDSFRVEKGAKRPHMYPFAVVPFVFRRHRLGIKTCNPPRDNIREESVMPTERNQEESRAVSSATPPATQQNLPLTGDIQY